MLPAKTRSRENCAVPKECQRERTRNKRQQLRGPSSELCTRTSLLSSTAVNTGIRFHRGIRRANCYPDRPGLCSKILYSSAILRYSFTYIWHLNGAQAMTDSIGL